MNDRQTTPKAIPPPSVMRFARPVGVALLRVLVFMVLVIAALPISMLPLTTSVPAPVWIPLAIVDLGFIVVLFWFKWMPRAVGAAFAGAFVILLLAVIASQVFATTPPINDAQGKPLPNGIAALEQVNLNGADEWITIRGKDVNNPVLLNLGMGGPGGGGFATRTLFEPLEDRFTVVSWDEPGTGKSYNSVPIRSLTPKRFIEDAHALTLLLRDRFHQDKIYVYGVSWTSILGIWLVQQYPDLYAAYIGSGQMVNTTENDRMGYQLALRYANDRGDIATTATLRQNGPPPYSGDGLIFKYLAFFDVLNDYMGAPRFALVVPIVPFLAPEYGLLDKVNHTRGLVDSFSVVYPQLKDLDFTTQANKLQVPVYLFVGKNDVNAMASLAERYYNSLEAPHKELIWLEGGHGLSDESLGQFIDVLVNRVLAQNQPLPIQ